MTTTATSTVLGKRSRPAHSEASSSDDDNLRTSRRIAPLPSNTLSRRTSTLLPTTFAPKLPSTSLSGGSTSFPPYRAGRGNVLSKRANFELGYGDAASDTELSDIELDLNRATSQDPSVESEDERIDIDLEPSSPGWSAGTPCPSPKGKGKSRGNRFTLSPSLSPLPSLKCVTPRKRVKLEYESGTGSGTGFDPLRFVRRDREKRHGLGLDDAHDYHREQDLECPHDRADDQSVEEQMVVDMVDEDVSPRKQMSLVPTVSVLTTKLYGLATQSSAMLIDDDFHLTERASTGKDTNRNPSASQHSGRPLKQRKVKESPKQALIPVPELEIEVYSDMQVSELEDTQTAQRAVSRREKHRLDPERAPGASGTSHLRRSSPSSLLPLREKRRPRLTSPAYLTARSSYVADLRARQAERAIRRYHVRCWNERIDRDRGADGPSMRRWSLAKWQEENNMWVLPTQRNSHNNAAIAARAELLDVEDVEMGELSDTARSRSIDALASLPLYGPLKRTVSPIPELRFEAVVSDRWAKRNQIRLTEEVQPYLDALRAFDTERQAQAVRAAVLAEWRAQVERQAEAERLEAEQRRLAMIEAERIRAERVAMAEAAERRAQQLQEEQRQRRERQQSRALLSPIELMMDDEEQCPISPPTYRRALWSSQSPPPPPPYNARTDRETLVAPLILEDCPEDEALIAATRPRPRPIARATAAAAAAARRSAPSIVGAYPSAQPQAQAWSVSTTQSSSSSVFGSSSGPSASSSAHVLQPGSLPLGPVAVTAESNTRPHILTPALVAPTPVRHPDLFTHAHRSFDVALELEEGPSDHFNDEDEGDDDDAWIEDAVGAGSSPANHDGDYNQVHDTDQADEAGGGAGLVGSVGRWFRTWF